MYETAAEKLHSVSAIQGITLVGTYKVCEPAPAVPPNQIICGQNGQAPH